MISTYFVQSNALFYFIYDESLNSQNYLQVIETILGNVLETLSLQQYSKYRIFLMFWCLGSMELAIQITRTYASRLLCLGQNKKLKEFHYWIRIITRRPAKNSKLRLEAGCSIWKSKLSVLFDWFGNTANSKRVWTKPRQ